MAYTQKNELAFIIRIWREPAPKSHSESPWRGMVENAETGARKYFITLEELVKYLQSHLAEMGVKN